MADLIFSNQIIHSFDDNLHNLFVFALSMSIWDYSLHGHALKLNAVLIPRPSIEVLMYLNTVLFVVQLIGNVFFAYECVVNSLNVFKNSLLLLLINVQTCFFFIPT